MSNQPSAAYRRHHDVEAPRIDARAFRQGWRVRSRLDVLLRDGRLTPGQWQAAVEYRAAWERAHAPSFGGGAGLELLHCGGGGDGDHLAGLADTLRRLREVEARIGRLASALCFVCIVQDQPWADLGRLWGCDPHTVRDRTVAAIRRLAIAWNMARRLPSLQTAIGTGQRPGAV